MNYQNYKMKDYIKEPEYEYSFKIFGIPIFSYTKSWMHKPLIKLEK